MKLHVSRMYPSSQATLVAEDGRTIRLADGGVSIGWTSYECADAILVQRFLLGVPAESYWSGGPQPYCPDEATAAAIRLLDVESRDGHRPVMTYDLDDLEARSHTGFTVHLD